MRRAGPRSRVGLCGCALVAAAAALAACQELPDERAEALVRFYNKKIIEAYRSSDVRLVEGVTSPRQARRLAGLIGVKRDMGITLDARLVSLVVRSVTSAEDAVIVTTKERWSYADRRIGSGAIVGQPSKDRYRMAYTLKKIGKRWVVDRLRFIGKPIVGRKTAPNKAPVRVLHGIGGPGPKKARARKKTP